MIETIESRDSRESLLSNQNDIPTGASDEADGTSDFKVGEPNWEDNPTIMSDEADGTSDFKVGEPNWND